MVSSKCLAEELDGRFKVLSQSFLQKVRRARAVDPFLFNRMPFPERVQATFLMKFKY